MKRLRGDLERVRTMAELCRKRESRKLRQTQLVADMIKTVIFAHEDTMRNVFDKIAACVSLFPHSGFPFLTVLSILLYFVLTFCFPPPLFLYHWVAVAVAL